MALFSVLYNVYRTLLSHADILNSTTLWLQHFSLALTSSEVGLPVKVPEQVQENEPIEDVEPREDLVHVAAEHHGGHHVKDHNHKLSQLQTRDVLLPPQIFSILWTQSTNAVVDVHEDVHQ